MSAPAPESASATPAEILIEHVGLEKRTTAEMQDLYSRPIPPERLPEVRRAA
ncbi:MAG TPA: hypothetical protein VM094_06600 [Gemmatimonadales bacterium]|nr:hypothetical protein [Gemmatimonadales bacterium]